MAARILFFGATAEIVGTRMLEVDPETDATAGSVLKGLEKDHPALSCHKLKVAINQTHATESDRIGDGDEVAIFTAVSGG